MKMLKSRVFRARNDAKASFLCILQLDMVANEVSKYV